MADKRKADSSSALVAVPKKAKNNANAGAIVAAGELRCSSMEAPIMLLSGHGDQIFSSKFNHDGSLVASGSFDRQIFLWNTKTNENYAVLTGHQGAILSVQWSKDSSQLYSASTDKTCQVWDAETGERVRKMRGHTSIVNTCCVARDASSHLVTGSDDGTIKIWDTRHRGFVHSLANKYQVTAACFGATSNQVITGGLDNVVKVWDMRKLEVEHKMEGHKNTVTGLALSPDGNHVISNSMDNSVKMWDVRPYATSRLVKTFKGAQHNFEQNLIKCAWTPDGKHIACGSADRNVYVWNVMKGNILYRLPGHTGSVNDVDFHPGEPIILSGSSDRRMYLGELNNI